MPTKHILINGDCRKMGLIQDESVQLIVTSPPYWQLKDYGHENQIGFNDTYEQYINNLNLVWKECYRVLEPGCRLCVNIGDQFARSVYYGRYKVIPIHSEIIRFCENCGFDYMGSIVWQKPTSMHTTGGANVMGSYPYPRGGIVKIDFENILIFKKLGKPSCPTNEAKEASKLTMEEWNEYFSSHWHFNGDKQNKHIATFPEELPMRFIRMFSFVGDTILDPFMGSGTTALAALKHGRNSIGYEINKEFRSFYQNKVVASSLDSETTFEIKEDNEDLNLSVLMGGLPYKFVDVHKLDKNVDVKENTYGSKFETDKNLLSSEVSASVTLTSNDTVERKDDLPMVLVNHVRRDKRLQMIEKGICYLRAGESHGSVLVEPGFERMQYILLHTAGNEPMMFKLKAKGKFQIWTRETLEQHGFHPQNAAYYIVLHFDGKHPIVTDRMPNLCENVNTYRAKIKSLSEFI